MFKAAGALGLVGVFAAAQLAAATQPASPSKIGREIIISSDAKVRTTLKYVGNGFNNIRFFDLEYRFGDRVEPITNHYAYACGVRKVIYFSLPETELDGLYEDDPKLTENEAVISTSEIYSFTDWISDFPDRQALSNFVQRWCAAVPGAPLDEEIFMTNSGNKTMDSIITRGIKVNGSRRTAWFSTYNIRFLNTKFKGSDDNASLIIVNNQMISTRQAEFDCDNRSSRTLNYISFDSDGSSKENQEISGPFSSIAPRTMGELNLEIICLIK